MRQLDQKKKKFESAKNETHATYSRCNVDKMETFKENDKRILNKILENYSRKH